MGKMGEEGIGTVSGRTAADEVLQFSGQHTDHLFPQQTQILLGDEVGSQVQQTVGDNMSVGIGRLLHVVDQHIAHPALPDISRLLELNSHFRLKKELSPLTETTEVVTAPPNEQSTE
jgi:hypothetical protein